MPETNVLIAVKNTLAGDGRVSDAVEFLSARGADVRTLDIPDCAGIPGVRSVTDARGKGFAFAASFGGDGTFIRVAKALLGSGVPLLGINMGKVGYLSDCDPDAAPRTLARLLAGPRAIEERIALSISIGDRAFAAINELAISRGASGHVLSLRVRTGVAPDLAFRADGVIVCTPTGSTAYNLSAGGPILAPSVKAVCVAPVCPYSPDAKPLVIPDDAIVTITAKNYRPDEALARLIVDGAVAAPVEDGVEITIAKRPEPVLLIRAASRGTRAEPVRR